MSARRLLVAAAATTLLLTSAACSGGGGKGPSGPTEPTGGLAAGTIGQVLTTAAGAVEVVSYGCGQSLDLGRMEGELYTTCNIAELQNRDAFASAGMLDGFEIHARTAEETRKRCDGNAACFERVGDVGRLHVICDGGGLEHETAHALAWAAKLDCWQSVYHSRNFRCEKTDDLYGS